MEIIFYSHFIEGQSGDFDICKQFCVALSFSQLCIINNLPEYRFTNIGRDASFWNVFTILSIFIYFKFLGYFKVSVGNVL